MLILLMYVFYVIFWNTCEYLEGIESEMHVLCVYPQTSVTRWRGKEGNISMLHFHFNLIFWKLVDFRYSFILELWLNFVSKNLSASIQTSQSISQSWGKERLRHHWRNTWLPICNSFGAKTYNLICYKLGASTLFTNVFKHSQHSKAVLVLFGTARLTCM